MGKKRPGAEQNKLKKKKTITSIARELEVSTTTVSFVLNGRAKEFGIAKDTIDRIMKATDGMAYVPNAFARGLRLSKSHLIGVVFPHLRNNWAHRIMTGINIPLEKSGHIPFIINHDENAEQEERQINLLIEHQAGAFIIDPVLEGIKTYRRIQKLGIPLVFISDALKEMPEVPYAAWDPNAVSTAVRHLLKSGRRKIGYIGFNDNRIMANKRYTVYCGVMKAAGISIRNDWLVMPPAGTPMIGAVKESFVNAKSKPDAYFCVYNDLAYETFIALKSIGVKIPHDVAIATLDDSLAGSPDFCDITVVTAPVEKEGQGAANLILDVINKPDKIHNPIIVKGGKLIVRSSTLG